MIISRLFLSETPLFCIHPWQVSLLWAGGSILAQHIDNIGFHQPFTFVYMGSVVLSGCIPSYLVCAAVGLAVNPRFRDAPGWY